MNTERKGDQVKWIAAKNGLTASALTCAVSSSAVYLLVKRYPKFAQATGASGRVASALLPALFMGVVSAERTAGIYANEAAYRSPENTKNLDTPIFTRAKELVIEHPVYLVGALGLPAIGSIFYMNSRLGHLSFSQKMMHTRVYGQFSVLALICSFGLLHFLDDSQKKN